MIIDFWCKFQVNSSYEYQKRGSPVGIFHQMTFHVKHLTVSFNEEVVSNKSVPYRYCSEISSQKFQASSSCSPHAVSSLSTTQYRTYRQCWMVYVCCVLDIQYFSQLPAAVRAETQPLS